VLAAHGNGVPALAALAARSTPVWHGRGGTHGRLRAGLAWGIDPWAWCDAGGEVTGQEADGAGLALPGCPRRAQRRPGRRGVAGLVLCHAGSR
jgi:hypothetical protein